MSQDAVVLHCQTVKSLPWDSIASDWPAVEGCLDSVPSLATLHDAYVERFDTFRDPEHAARVRTAIQVAAERAGAGEALSWEGLCSLQCVVLGCESVGFREGPAYARARLETYGSHPRLEEALTKKLVKNEGDALHPLLKACRVYLDVRFFHPFAEANGAAARLAFQWLAEREGIRLPELTPIFRLPILPGNAEEYQAFFDSAASLLARACEEPPASAE
ncbi:MAG: Fic family protein [Planctomycetes bacterium]|nr:Fic family protein [Planctomycetota bacterium]